MQLYICPSWKNKIKKCRGNNYTYLYAERALLSVLLLLNIYTHYEMAAFAAL